MFFFKKKKVTSELIDTNPIRTPQQYFAEYKWVKIEKFLTPEVCQLLDFHIKMSSQRYSYTKQLVDHGNKNFSSLLNRHFSDCPDCSCKGSNIDPQAPGDYSKYGDPIFDDILNLCSTSISQYIGIELIPTYSYHRLYTTGAELVKHKDRESCEYSATVCLGYDNSNLNQEQFKDWNWPIFVEHEQNEEKIEIPVYLNPGDIMIYKGCEVTHWREPLIGKNQTQLFLHFNEKNGKFNHINDKRPMLGLPLCTKTLCIMR